MSSTSNISQPALPPQGGSISIEAARALLAAGAFLVDVRGEFELDQEPKIENAVNIPLSTIGKGGEKQIPPNRIILVYCKMGQRSKTAVTTLAKANITSYSIDGGLRAWKLHP
jgi:rhodanese-related sulfurtransferase